MSSTPFSELAKIASEAKFTVVPPAEYPVIVKNCTATRASTGKDMLKFTVAVLAGPHKSATIPTQQVLSPENPTAVAIFLKHLAAFGIEEDFLAGLPPREDGGPNMQAVADELVGRCAMAVVGIRPWEGEDRNDITRFKKPNPEQELMIKEAKENYGTDLPVAGAKKDPFASAPASGGTAAPAGQPF